MLSGCWQMVADDTRIEAEMGNLGRSRDRVGNWERLRGIEGN